MILRKRKSLNSFFKNRTGDFSLDLLFVVILIFVVGLAWIFMGDTFTTLNDEFQADSTMSAEAKANLGQVHDGFNSNFDGLIAFLFFGASLFVIISSWFLDSHPVFFVITLIMLAIVISVIVVLANSFEEVVTDDDFVSTTNEFPLTIFIFSHIVGLIIGIGFISAVVMYGKFRGGL